MHTAVLGAPLASPRLACLLALHVRADRGLKHDRLLTADALDLSRKPSSPIAESLVHWLSFQILTALCVHATAELAPSRHLLRLHCGINGG